MAPRTQDGEVGMDRFNRVTSAVFLPCIVVLCGCQDLLLRALNW